MKGTYILAIESSCDETAAAVVKNGREVLSNVISSQIALHTLYGGVVPEIASRKHIEKINPVITEALAAAKMSLADMDAIAVTYGPGLVGSLLVGVAEAKAIAFAANKPLIGVHHIEGHVSANYISHPDLEPPFLCLVVSGGHTHIVMVEDYGTYRIIGRTHDDAAGEAYDKIARAIGLGYPGGPKVDALAKQGDPNAIAFPRAHIEDCPYDFSFSGLKSAVLNYLNIEKMKARDVASRGAQEASEAGEASAKPGELARHGVPTGGDAEGTEACPDTFSDGVTKADLAASFQEAVVDVLVTRTIAAAKAEGVTTVAIAGGVASNSALRNRMREVGEANGMRVVYPEPVLCTDNAAMIGAAAYYEFLRGNVADLTLNAVPGLKLGER
ncbi:MAG: tRNA (adenosine(37)-N6)-threonylcarbamoyltransferase complex transferase subunit TsaD [Lachnospiraceae bacterium]|nr:tRNA (adenosine(37)-N6)-threonylcarbamoyltransferase complex transferase subunit TsaD [Lachnospiraceae bacterium]